MNLHSFKLLFLLLWVAMSSCGHDKVLQFSVTEVVAVLPYPSNSLTEFDGNKYSVEGPLVGIHMKIENLTNSYVRFKLPHFYDSDTSPLRISDHLSIDMPIFMNSENGIVVSPHGTVHEVMYVDNSALSRYCQSQENSCSILKRFEHDCWIYYKPIPNLSNKDANGALIFNKDFSIHFKR